MCAFCAQAELAKVAGGVADLYETKAEKKALESGLELKADKADLLALGARLDGCAPRRAARHRPFPPLARARRTLVVVGGVVRARSSSAVGSGSRWSRNESSNAPRARLTCQPFGVVVRFKAVSQIH